MTMSIVRRGLVAVCATASLAAWPVPGGPAAADCAGPSLSLAGADGAAGSLPVVTLEGPTEVVGRGFVDGCDDTGGGSVWGCGSGEGEVETPLSDVELVVRQGGRTWELGTADAGTAADGRLGQVAWQAQLPSGLEPGRAVLVAGHDARLPVRLAPSTR